MSVNFLVDKIRERPFIKMQIGVSKISDPKPSTHNFNYVIYGRPLNEF